MRFIYISLSLLIFSSLAHANCSYGELIDLRKAHSKVYNKIPIFNQGQIGICYAYTATSLVDFYRFKNSNAVSNLSPLEAGILSKIKNENHGEDGGVTCEVVNALVERGYGCSKAKVAESKFKGVGMDIHRILVTEVMMPFISKTETLKAVSAAQFTSRSNLTKSQKSFLVRFDNAYKKIDLILNSKGFTRAEKPSAYKVLNLLQNIHFQQKYGALAGEFNMLILKGLCSDSQLRVPRLNCEEISGDSYTLQREIDNSLHHKKPLGINYCANVLKNKGYKGINAGVTKRDCEAHASVLIGKKFNEQTGRCSYLIRNSWGKNISYAWETSEGDIWVDEKALLNNTTGISVVD